MSIRTEGVSYGFGQLGSFMLDTTNAVTVPAGKVVVAIQMLEDVTFADAGGLIADTTDVNVKYISTDVAAEPGLTIDTGNVFPKGSAIMGRWTGIDLASGSIIAYLGY
tara:strand:+ start:9388 stop:9711 length:324 start_codon:yes stop_codon:yes gene_type:complete